MTPRAGSSGSDARRADALKIDRSAEGIEMAAPLVALQTLGCDHGQGHYLARPMASVATTGLLASSGGASPLSPVPAMIYRVIA
jgi:predicted signal transduction protein with EAL and GGDEF domain